MICLAAEAKPPPGFGVDDDHEDVLAALALIVLLLTVVWVAMHTVVSGIRGEHAPLRWLRPVSRHITVKTEMLDLDRRYQDLVPR